MALGAWIVFFASAAGTPVVVLATVPTSRLIAQRSVSGDLEAERSTCGSVRAERSVSGTLEAER
jgi:hypothetical protein